MGILGINCKVYRNTGSYGTPTWTAVDAFRDVTLRYSWDEVEAPSRASKIKSVLKALGDYHATGEIKCSYTDAGYLAITAALNSQTSNIDLLILNGTSSTNGAEGVRLDALITTGDEDQGIGNALYRSVTMKQDAAGANGLKLVTVASGAPVYTAF